MLHKLKSPAVAGGIGSLIVTLVIFFADGGFKNMNPWYILGLVVGIGLIIYGLVTNNGNVVKTRAKDEIHPSKWKGLSDAEFAQIELAVTSMKVYHGHIDHNGLIDDQKNKKPLNGPCWRCGRPRFEKGGPLK
jgi:hypothetical protein